MRAYNLCMLMIFINCGMAIAVAMGAFGNTTPPDNAYSGIQGFINTPFQIGLFNFQGADIILVIAAVMIIGTIVYPLNSRPYDASSVAIAVFACIFWVSVGITSTIFLSIRDPDGSLYPGLSIFIGIYFIAAFLIFAIALVQMPTGGQKTHV